MDINGNQQIPNFKDKVYICGDCNQPFIFEKGEQKYYWIHDLDIPKRCHKCRLARKLNAKVGGNND